MPINFSCRPAVLFCFVLFPYTLSFPLLAVITALTLYPLFITHTNSVYGSLPCALLLMITAPAQKVFLFKPSHQFTDVERLVASALSWWRILPSGL